MVVRVRVKRLRVVRRASVVLSTGFEAVLALRVWRASWLGLWCLGLRPPFGALDQASFGMS